MRPLRYPLLADENINPEVILQLRSQGKDIRDCREEHLAGKGDVEVLRRAYLLGRVILTHDQDFGALAIRGSAPFIGIVYLRPGHIKPGYVLQELKAIEQKIRAVKPPFLIVAERKNDAVRIRLRSFQSAHPGLKE
jgi:predicted nuclease of predicted toxin-antitoxin system